MVGIGGVGSWAAEALARSGVGRLRLIDLDHIAESNINRQVHALEGTLGMAKVEVMRSRIADINPEAVVEAVDDFLVADNARSLIEGSDYVVDAIDQLGAKLALVLACRDQGIALVCAGGAGGKCDPGKIVLSDLSRTEHDPLLARLRKKMRSEHGFPRNPRRRFGIEAVYSGERMRRPDGDSAPAGLSCAGYGSSMVVTASIGMYAAARVIEQLARGD